MEKKIKIVSSRVTNKDFLWLKEKKIPPTKVWELGLKELKKKK